MRPDSSVALSIFIENSPNWTRTYPRGKWTMYNVWCGCNHKNRIKNVFNFVISFFAWKNPQTSSHWLWYDATDAGGCNPFDWVSTHVRSNQGSFCTDMEINDLVLTGRKKKILIVLFSDHKFDKMSKYHIYFAFLAGGRAEI